MEAISVEILNPKAKKLLLNLEELNLISIHTSKLSLSQRLTRLRRNESKVPSLEEITQEVETVRKQRRVQNNH